MSSDLTATVVVARTARENSHVEAEAWLQSLITQARKTPGFIRSEIQRPIQQSNDWVVIYEFSNNETLTDWLASPARLEIGLSEATIFDGAAREQVLATSGRSNAVTGVSSFLLKRPSNTHDADAIERAFFDIYREIVDVVEDYEGFISCDLLESKAGLQEEMIIVFSFDSRDNLDGWFHSVRRMELLDRIDPLLAESRTTNVVGGFAGWFAPGRQTPTWKQATLVLLALYPTALVVGFIRNQIAPDLSFPVATFIGNALGVIILSWFLMPPLTSRFQRWLSE